MPNQKFEKSRKTTLPKHAPAVGPSRSAVAALTLEEIQSEPLSKLAASITAPNAAFSEKTVRRIYEQELKENDFSPRRLLLLEINQYLEKYLWPNYNEKNASLPHTLSIVLMVNEKVRERVAPWVAFLEAPEHFPLLFSNVLKACLPPDSDVMSFRERRFLLQFMIHCFGSLENAMVREECMKICSLSTWHCIAHPQRREQVFREYPQLLKFWKHLEKRYSVADESGKKDVLFKRKWLSEMIKVFLSIVESFSDEDPVPEDQLHYCERFLEFLIDLESQLPTRRYFNTLLDDHQVVTACSLSRINRRKDDATLLFRQLTATLKFYAGFELNDQTGLPLTEEEMMQKHYDRIVEAQKLAFAQFRPTLIEFALANVSSVDTRTSLQAHFSELSDENLLRFCESNFVRTRRVNASEDRDTADDRKFLLEAIVSRFERRQSQIQKINSTSLYPDENILFDDAIIQSQFYNGEYPLNLPKLNLQFLTIHDYLLRNFNLFRLETVYEIRQDIEDAVKRLNPSRTHDGTTAFGGWSRMACEIERFNIVDVGKPKLGERKPSRVKADVTFNIGKYTESIRRDWDSLRPHDVVFFLAIDAPDRSAAEYKDDMAFRPYFGLKYVRGGEITDIIGDDGKPIDEFARLSGIPRKTKGGPIEMRTVRVALDPNQYQTDLRRKTDETTRDVYETFNVILRRRPKENNFKAVLETIRDLMQSDLVVPDWLQNVFLGYGDPASAHYSRMPSRPLQMDYRDTFLNWDHLQEVFDGAIKTAEGFEVPLDPPYVIEFKETQVAPPPSKKRKKAAAEALATNDKATDKFMAVRTYTPIKMGPYLSDQPNKNTVKFTSMQIEAITAGMSHGLTMVVGPPGTGKTDVAVQIIANLYHNFPDQHTLLVTHSNQALNQLFEKIMALDIDERHLLRLGHGEEELNTEESFSKAGRVNSFLERRFKLLSEVDRLARSLEIGGDHAYTCETAGYFYTYHILPRWESFISRVETESWDAEKVAQYFPFAAFFNDAPQPLFPEGVDNDETLETARGCFRHIEKIFTELDAIQAFELLRTNRDRADYLLTKEAKIMAMTCTHAALKRRDLVRLGFKYDTIIMEEAAQILEVETFIPMLLQEPQDGRNRLKRVVLIGDHNQLPPVVKNTAFQKYGNMEQSMFARFVRLGVPTIQLDQQGRARASLAELYRWRYKGLGDLPAIEREREYHLANAGFAYDYQMINVENYAGKGESEPTAYFYQNLGEAEYVVAVYQYMRLLGYPAEKIAILTTYNGQKALIRDVLQQRCAWNPIFGHPSKVTTVDKYQGQQADYILLSLVRTKSVGHIRDVRRLVVALSRARLGLYIFCHRSLFENCYELSPAFKLLSARPDKLQLRVGEMFPSTRDVKDFEGAHEIQDVAHMGVYVHQMMKEQLKFAEEQMQS